MSRSAARSVDLTERFVTADYRLEVMDGSSHWLPNEQPAELAGLIARRVGLDGGMTAKGRPAEDRLRRHGGVRLRAGHVPAGDRLRELPRRRVAKLADRHRRRHRWSPLIWARWMAPSSSHRLTDPGRYVAQAVLFVAIGALAAVSGLLWLGVVFTVTSLVAFAFSRTEHHGQ